ncbi:MULTISPECIES: NAD(P)H-binding protein [unclassified Streptomyces]|uniref:NAD(P)H-binding protein n=1 Tax=unclassified Streptomyces TaxID=2593676 RepID=UPI00381CCBA9
MNITVLGATGATGRLVVEQLLAQGHSVRAVVRTPARAAELRSAGIETAELDLAAPTAAALAGAFASTEAVINAAATRSMTKKQAELIDHRGVVAAIDAAAAAGVRHWVQVSMMGSGDKSRLPRYLRATGEAKDAADGHLMHSGLTWTVVRPPWLNDGAARGRISAGAQVEEGQLSRADLAAVAVAALTVPATHNRTFEVTDGPRPLAEALQTLA